MSEPPRKPILPPHSIRRDFLPAELADALLDFAIASEAKFKPAGVGHHTGRRTDPQIRRSLTFKDFGPFKTRLRERLAPLAPLLTAELKTSPFRLLTVEVELAAHNDGAFFREHIDTQPAEPDAAVKSQRMLSGVYYFHGRPKGFTGGNLRLLELMPRGADRAHVDVEPLHNSLIAFPAWMPHEVLPVTVPTHRFADSRFAINIWFHRAV